MIQTAGTAGVLPDRAGWLELVDRFGAAAIGGLAAGFLVGGIGGRLAMFVLRLTSPDYLRGFDTDDGFGIGEITFDTLFLVGVTTLLGTVVAYGYLVVRRWLPVRGRPLQAAAFFGLVGGAAIVKPEGVDFTLVEPAGLAIALFVVLPAAYGALMAVVVERLVEHPGRARKTRVAGIVGFVGVGFFGLMPAVLAAAGLVLVLVGRRWPAAAGAVRGPVPTWLVRTALVGLGGVAAVQLVQDGAEIL